jgi:hypothetical protein
LIDTTVAAINALDNNSVLNSTPTELEQFYIEEVTLDPLTLHTDQIGIENRVGTMIDVSHDFSRAIFSGQRAFVQGTRLDIAVPYEGNHELWRVRASTHSLSGYPEIEIRGDSIVFSVSFPDDAADQARIKSEIDRQLKSLADAIQYLKNDVENHNRSAPETIRTAIQNKRKLAQSSTSAVAALGIPMIRRDQPLTYIAPIKRRQSPVRRPGPATEAYKREPMLEEAEYQHILTVMRSMSLVIERSPQTFPTLDEEAIRTHFLIQLNGHYEGTATGETFNAAGKTDILIRVDDRNIFIAECKFWRGPSGFDEAIEQLLSYLSWRDSKCALVIFNRTKNSSAVHAKMHDAIIARAEYRKTVTHEAHGDSRYVLVQNSDEGRGIIVTTMLFDIPNE